MGTHYRLIRNLGGFYRYSPADGGRYPASGYATIDRLFFYNDLGISEAHGGSDEWVDMWRDADSSNNYESSDSVAARGTKCIAGYCFEKTPIWMMVR